MFSRRHPRGDPRAEVSDIVVASVKVDCDLNNPACRRRLALVAEQPRPERAVDVHVADIAHACGVGTLPDIVEMLRTCSQIVDLIASTASAPTSRSIFRESM